MSVRRAALLLRLFTAFCLAATFSITVFLALAAGPYVERWLFGPVVSKLTISNLGKSAEGHAVIMAEFTKLRDCEYIGMAWFRGDRATKFERVPVVLPRKEGDSSSPNRPEGHQRAGPWIIHMPPEEIAWNSFAFLHHRCHGLWLTTTEFFP